MHAYFGDKGGAKKLKKLLDEGFDSHKRMGNSAIRGVGANSPAMMEARKHFKHTALKKKTFMSHIAEKAEHSDRERTGQGGRHTEQLMDKYLGKKK